jgi:membrane carboxypeptidase/penicillin-binding protein PbpC
LATVTGAVETRLLDLTNAYATLARDGAQRPVRLFVDESAPTRQAMAPNVAATLNEVLSLAARTGRSGDGPWCMWKTGTSAGRRDAWAVGHNGRFAVGVWVGAVQGPGRAEYVGSVAAEPVFLELMRHPMLRQDRAPAAPEPIRVGRPIGPPVDAGRGPLRILRPEPGGRYVSLDGRCVIHPLANRADGLQWFLNGRRIEPERTARLVLQPGQYELRVVDSTGLSAAVEFHVR